MHVSNLFLALCLLFLWTIGAAQTITIDADDIPLKELLFDIKQQHNLQLSYNNQTLSNCIITKKQQYLSPEQAFRDLLKPCTLTFEKAGDIFIILPIQRLRVVSGTLRDSWTHEPLPNATIRLQRQNLSTDAIGHFSFKTSDTLVSLQLFYPGYYEADTTLSVGTNHQIFLEPSQIHLSQTSLYANKNIFDMHIGKQAGVTKLNHKLAPFLSGNINNSIYNLLRLQPGIMASGEQNRDYIMWGSYKGQTLVVYDRTVLFNTASFDDNFGVVNPMMVKDIEVFKGGYDAQYSNRIGGVVNITGKQGNSQKITGDINLSNLSGGGMLNIPIYKTMVMQVSYRKSFENDISVEEDEEEDEFLDATYNFSDLNFKLSATIAKTHDFYIQYLNSDDNKQTQFGSKGELFENEIQERKQYGMTFFYNKTWSSGAKTNFTLSRSELKTNIDSEIDVFGSESDNIISTDVRENKMAFVHELPIGKVNRLNMGLEWVLDESNFGLGIENEDIEQQISEVSRTGIYLIDHIAIKNITIDPGLRVDLANDQIYLQPRLLTSYNLTDRWTINAAWGRYNQFVSENTLTDEFGNQLFIWSVNDEESMIVPTAYHYVSGVSYDHPNFNFSLEGFYKQSNNISRFVTDDIIQLITRDRTVSLGNSTSYGMDLFFKTKFKKHELWAAYTLSNTWENFAHFRSNEDRLAPQHQDYEIKTAAILNFSPFYFSANYIYGSGLQFTQRLEGKLIPYDRLDLSLLYRLKRPEATYKLGLSLLNAFNVENIKYQDFTVFNQGESVRFAQALPITGMINLNITF